MQTMRTTTGTRRVRGNDLGELDVGSVVHVDERRHTFRARLRSRRDKRMPATAATGMARVPRCRRISASR